jgi:hypothetical protein
MALIAVTLLRLVLLRHQNKRKVCATNLRLQVLNVSRLNILADNKRRNSLFLAGGGAARA